MLITFFRAIVLYIVVLIVMRLMGKREIGQLQPFELAISIMIADLASIPMTEIGIPIFNGIIPILGLLVMHLIISVINLKSLKAREVICGKPSILIYRGKINEKELKKERFTINELEERLRGNNVVNLGDVEYAILESSGTLSIFPYENGKSPLPLPIILDGDIQEDTIKHLKKDKKWVYNFLDKKNINIEDVFFAFYKDKNIFIIRNDDLIK